jgi:hypothetical protein
MTKGRPIVMDLQSVRMGRSTGRAWWLAVPVMVSALCCADNPVTPTSVSTLSGDWLVFSITTNSCPSSLPFGYGVAPRGGGTATIVENGNEFDGQLFIFNQMAGTIHGTITNGNIVSAQLNLDGQNVGPSTPCRVVGSGNGSTDRRCFISLTASADFACPYECNPATIFVSVRGHSGQDNCPR